MFRLRLTTKALIVLGLGLLVAAQMAPASLARSPGRAPATTASTTARQNTLQADYGQLPISFEVNVGQTDPAARFLAHGGGYSLALSDTGATLTLTPAQSAAPGDGKLRDRLAPLAMPATTPIKTAPPATVNMAWLGANPHPVVSGEDPLPGTVNYFLGNNPAQWHTNIPTYQQVRLHEVYPGVDLVYYGTSGQLEYDFVVAPGANPAHIALGFTGTQRIGVDLAGNLALSLPGGMLQQDHPAIYQTAANGARQTVAGGYALGNHGRVGFALGAYNPRLPLVIDPAYKFSTYLGGNNTDTAGRIALDASGNAYVVGSTASTNFPTQSPLQASNAGGTDAFVTKLNAAGTALLYSTYLGGSGSDNGGGIAVDASGNAYISGSTSSTDFPTHNPLQAANAGGSDQFVTKLNATGSALLYSTYLGGSGTDGGSVVGVDASGNVYVGGITTSTNFPMVNAVQASNGGGNDAFVSKINAAGSALVYSTYLGGTLFDGVFGLAADASGNAYITGVTASSNFPTLAAYQATPNGQDAFVAKFTATGTLVYSTYLGGSGNEVGVGIAADASGNAYVTGETSSTDFPTVNPLQATNHSSASDGFVTKFNATGSALTYSTYLGGSGALGDFGESIAVDTSGDAYITGDTTSTDFPLVNPLQSSLGSSNGDAFVSKVNAAGSALLFSTYLGGSGAAGDYGFGIAVGTGATVYVTGGTVSTDFPTVNALYPTYLGGSQDTFVTKIATRPSVDTTTGVFRPSNGVLYLKNANSTGPADITLYYGLPGDQPITGDWTGKGYKSIGIYRNGTFYLRNSNTTGFADITVAFGASGDIPVAGDWTGKGYDSIGVYRPSTSTFYLRDSNTSGAPDHTVTLGISGDVPIVGDWTAKGWDSVGVFRPSNGIVYLRNSNTTGFADINFVYGIASDKPVVGDWDHNGTDTIGVDRGGNFLLRNANTTGPANLSFYLGVSGDDPIAGPWLAPVGGLPAHP